MKRLLGFALLLVGMQCLAVRTEDRSLVVAQDGSGDYATIQEAINSVRVEMTYRTRIFIKKGVYREKLMVDSNVNNITLEGEDRDSTIIVWGDHANMAFREAGTMERNGRTVKAGEKLGTFRTYTLRVMGDGFRAVNLTIENDAEQLGQAVALHAEGRSAQFINCRFLGNQDTIYLGGTGKMYFKGCYVEGTTDFIFGSATGWFEGCEIRSKKNSYITAPSTPKESMYGLVFNYCKLTAEEGIDRVYLGRPWRPYGQSVFMNCDMGRHIRKEGWHNWNKKENEATARFVEINNNGEGSDLSGRVKWMKKGKEKDYSFEKVIY